MALVPVSRCGTPSPCGLKGRAVWVAGNPRTSTNIVSFYGDDRLAEAFYDPEAVLKAGAAPLQVHCCSPLPHRGRGIRVLL